MKKNKINCMRHTQTGCSLLLCVYVLSAHRWCCYAATRIPCFLWCFCFTSFFGRFRTSYTNRPMKLDRVKNGRKFPDSSQCRVSYFLIIFIFISHHLLTEMKCLFVCGSILPPVNSCSARRPPRHTSSYHLLLLLLLVVVVVVVSHSLDSSSPWLTGQAPVSLEWSNTPGTKHKENQKWYLVHAYIPGK